MKLLLKDDNGKYIDAIGFNMGYLSEMYKISSKIDIVGNLEINEYREIEKIQISLKDIRSTI